LLSKSYQITVKYEKKKYQKSRVARHKLIPVILATWKAELRTIKVQVQLRQIVCETLSPK
jgi:hypothetical protein